MKIPSRTRTMGFRLTEEDYALLVKVARGERRKLADMVYILVVEGLQRYARQIPRPDSVTRQQES
ncbi:MAG: hypothetical protein HS103_01340 [Anaerolineales bacterium]|nr:hypothetical protein [Anaerolineales bacterium]